MIVAGMLASSIVPPGPHSCSVVGPLLLASGSQGRVGCLPRMSWPGGRYWDVDRMHGWELPCPGLLYTPSASILEASQPFVIASFEMHAVLISNILIAPLISFKLHEKYKGLDQEIVAKF